MLETAKITLYFKTNEEPQVSALLKRKDGTIERLSGDGDYDLAIELVKLLDENRLSSSNEYGKEVLIPSLSLLNEDTSRITDEQIDDLFK